MPVSVKFFQFGKKNNSTAASYVYLYQMDDDSEVVDFIIIVK